ncbi:hypothetical protein TNCV_2357081 [Trichonephila clavipes]|nr:hypothetical protein TNCV_2357081 [Trichonephila clavipes]
MGEDATIHRKWSTMVSHLATPSTNPTKGLMTRRLFRVPYAAKALYIYKHPCLLRDSNPVPTAPQSLSLTTIPVEQLNSEM